MPWFHAQVLKIGTATALALACWELISQLEPKAVLLVSPFYFAAVVAAVVGVHMAVFVLVYLGLARLRPQLQSSPAKAGATALAVGAAIAVAIGVFAMRSLDAAAAGIVLAVALAASIAWARLDGSSEAWRAFVAKAPTVCLGALLALLAAVWWIAYHADPETAAQSASACLTYAAFILIACTPLLLIRPFGAGRSIAAVVLAALFLLPLQALIPKTDEENRRIVGDTNRKKIERIILIVVDTLRADVVSTINPHAPTHTPRLDEFAEDAILFENAISPAPWTFPSMNSMMTGVAPYIDRRAFTYDTAPLPTLGGHLARAGYTTRALIGNQILYRGIELTRGVSRITSYAAPPLGYGFFRSVVKNLVPGKTREHYPDLTRRLTDRAFEWLDAHRAEPAFLWLHHMDPHDPYAPPLESVPDGLSTDIWSRTKDDLTPAESEVAQALYNGEVELIDQEIGRLLDRLKEAGLYDDSLIVVTSDHGEEFLDHGGAFHGSSLYQELVHVPLIIRLPGGKGNRRVSEHVPTLALTPTILELAEMDVAPDPLWPEPLTQVILRGEDVRYSQPIVSAGVRRGEFQRSVVVDGLKYIQRIESGAEELYDLAADPTEQNSIMGERPEVVTKAKEALRAHETGSARLRAEFGLDGNSEVDEKMLNRLRSLGYIQ